MIASWRQSPASPAVWIVLWLVALFFQAWLWRWRVRLLRLLWAVPDVRDLHARPDAPWHLLRRLRRTHELRRAIQPSTTPQEETVSEPFLAEVRIVGFNFAPRNWAFCDGQILPINQNQSLY